MSNTYAIAVVAIASLVTIALRFLPFFVFNKKETPAYISYLGKYLPYAIMGMLVVYCLKNISFVQSPFGIPEAAAVVLVAMLHIWKRNTLLSIVGGTVVYMILVQVVF